MLLIGRAMRETCFNQSEALPRSWSVVTRHQYGISALVSQTSFRVETIISCGHTTDFYPGKTDLPRAISSKISRGKFISGFVLPR